MILTNMLNRKNTLKIWQADIPFKILRTGIGRGIFKAWDLIKEHFLESEDHNEIKNFLSNISVFTRWFSFVTGINDRFGDYEWQTD